MFKGTIIGNTNAGFDIEFLKYKGKYLGISALKNLNFTAFCTVIGPGCVESFEEA